MAFPLRPSPARQGGLVGAGELDAEPRWGRRRLRPQGDHRLVGGGLRPAGTLVAGGLCRHIVAGPAPAAIAATARFRLLAAGRLSFLLAPCRQEARSPPARRRSEGEGCLKGAPSRLPTSQRRNRCAQEDAARSRIAR